MDFDALRASVEGEVAADDAARETHARDASLFYVKPAVVVFPKDADDVKRLVSSVAGQKKTDPSVSLTARGAGTDMSGGPLTESIVVDMTRHMNRIVSVSAAGAVVEPGAYYRDFERATLAKNLLLPSYPASKDLCTVGGMASNNSGGEKTLAYGKTDRYVKRLTAVLSDGNAYEFRSLTRTELEAKKRLETFEGNIYRELHALLTENADVIEAARPRVSKNSAGYALWDIVNREEDTFDLTKLLVGSQGTLGILTEIEFALVRPKPHARILAIFLDDFAPLADVVGRVLAHHPESFESYDDHTLSIALKVFPKLVRKMKGNLLRLALQFLPEFRLALTGGIPKLVLIAEFTDETEEGAHRQATEAERDLASFGLKTHVTRSEAEGQKYWTVRRESFSLLREHVRRLRTAPFIDDFIVRPERLSSFLPELYAILGQYDLTFTVAGHAGDGNFHIIPLMDLRKPGFVRTIETLSRDVYGLVLRYDGSTTAEHNDGLVRSPYLPEMFGEPMMRLFEKTKRIFDPLNIFNPGKKVGFDHEYAMRHLDMP